jgi:hypothetical protein
VYVATQVHFGVLSSPELVVYLIVFLTTPWNIKFVIFRIVRWSGGTHIFERPSKGFLVLDLDRVATLRDAVLIL